MPWRLGINLLYLRLVIKLVHGLVLKLWNSIRRYFFSTIFIFNSSGSFSCVPYSNNPDLLFDSIFLVELHSLHILTEMFHFLHIDRIGSHMNQYLGVVLALFCVYTVLTFYRMENHINRIVSVDRELIKLLGSSDKIQLITRTQRRFEIICVTSFTILYIISSGYDFWISPP